MPNANIFLLVSTSALFWGANFVLGGFVLIDIPPLWAAAIVLGASLMFIIAGIKQEDLLTPLRKYFSTYIMLGVVGIVAFNLFFFYALRYTSANNGALIMATNPLFTVFLATIFLGERPTLRHLIALPIALVGVAVVVSHGKLSNLWSLQLSFGDVLMFGADIFWALYNVLCRRYMPQASPLVNTTWVMAGGAAVLLSIALVSDAHLAPLGFNAAMSMAVMVIGGTVLAYLFWSMGIARLGAGRTAIFINLVPVFAMLIGAVIATVPTASQLIGGLLVLSGVTISMLPSRRLVTT
jgi:drug/metabolite transporter (DMT)-like permease